MWSGNGRSSRLARGERGREPQGCPASLVAVLRPAWAEGRAARPRAGLRAVMPPCVGGSHSRPRLSAGQTLRPRGRRRGYGHRGPSASSCWQRLLSRGSGLPDVPPAGVTASSARVEPRSFASREEAMARRRAFLSQRRLQWLTRFSRRFWAIRWKPSGMQMQTASCEDGAI